MFSHVFIDRPILASVLSIVFVIVGTVALTQLPIAQYPEVAPPTISVTANYPGAKAKGVAGTVATPRGHEANGVDNPTSLGPRDYSMRVWLAPQKFAARQMTAGDVLRGIEEQNVQVAAGRLGQPPTPAGQNFQLTLNTLGRLESEDQFRGIVVKTSDDGSATYLRDVGADDRPDQKGVELGAKNYDVNSYLDRDTPITLAVFQLP